MPDMIANIDTAVTVPANILALMDDTDFKTREIAITYNQAGMDLVWNFQTHEGVTTQTAVTPTTGDDHDWTHSGDAMYKVEIPASGGDINNDAVGFGWFSGICTGVLAWRGPVIEFVAPNYWHNRYLGSHGPGVFYDDSAANTGTVLGTDGTRDTPVSTPAAARTIADALGIAQYYLINNSTMTLAATHTDWEFIGMGEITSNVLSLGSQDVGRSYGYNLCVEGTQGGTARMMLERCALAKITAGTTTLHIFGIDCGIVDDISLDTSADNVLTNPYSLVAGTGAPILRATGAAGTAVLRGLMGGVDIRDLSASHNVSVDGMGQVIFDASCNVNATVAIRGMFEITDSTAGMNNLTKTAVYNYDENVVATWDRVISKANHNVAGSAAKLLRELGVMIAVEGTTSGTPTTTSVTTGITGYDNDFFKDQTFMAYNGADMAGQSRIVLTYNGTTGVFTFGEAFTTALTSGDDVIVFSAHVHSIEEIADGVLAATPTNTLVGMPVTLGQFLYFIEQVNKNKLSYNKSTDDMIIYEDDGTTPKLTHAMVDDASEATRGAGT